MFRFVVSVWMVLVVACAARAETGVATLWGLASGTFAGQDYEHEWVTFRGYYDTDQIVEYDYEGGFVEWKAPCWVTVEVDGIGDLLIAGCSARPNVTGGHIDVTYTENWGRETRSYRRYELTADEARALYGHMQVLERRDAIPVTYPFGRIVLDTPQGELVYLIVDSSTWVVYRGFVRTDGRFVQMANHIVGTREGREINLARIN